MFFISTVIGIRSKLGLEATAALVAKSLVLPPFELDKTGRYEDQPMYLSHCFGLEFGFCHPNDATSDEYELSIMSDDDVLDFDGNEKDVDATAYALFLLKNAKEIETFPSPYNVST